MTETLMITGKPGLLSIRRIWLCIVAQVIATWGVLASVFLPLVQEQPGPPQEVETFAERYRLLTPDSPKQGKHLRSRLGRGVRRIPTFDSFEYTETSVSWSEYDIPAPPADRSCSTTACYDGSSTREREPKIINPVGRARSSSDPTGATSRAARRCMSFAADVAAKSTAPAHPIVKRACSAIQKSLTFTGTEEEDGDCGLGVGARTKTAIQVATTRTRKAINRTSTVATTAIMTASLKIAPGAKAEAQVETDEVTQVTANIEKSGDQSPETKPVLQPVPQQPRQPRRNVFSRKWTTFKKTRIFSRRRVVAVIE